MTIRVTMSHDELILLVQEELIKRFDWDEFPFDCRLMRFEVDPSDGTARLIYEQEIES